MTISQLPTPAATQIVPESASLPDPTPTTTVPTLTPTPTPTQTEEQDVHRTQSEQQNKKRRIEDAAQEAPDTQSERPAKKQHVTEESSQETSEQRTHTDSTELQQDAHVTTETSVEGASAGNEGATDTIDTRPVSSNEDDAATSGSQAGVLPWVAVNQPQAAGGDQPPQAPPKKGRQPPKPRGRKKATVPVEDGTETVEEVATNDGSESQPTRRRTAASAKARGKRPADEAGAEDGADGAGPAKRTRRPRQAKDKGQAEATQVGGEDEQENAEEELATRRKPRKPRQPRRKKSETVEGEAQVNADGSIAQPKRKGRPPREATPPEAEHQTIDPDDTFMDSLATRNIRVGQLSRREQEMRKIDWVAVRQRQREEDSRPIETREIREEREKAMAELPQVTEQGPRFVEVDGRIEMLPSSTVLNREADADREIDNYVTVEERDLTSRITSRSFMKNNKRFPNEFILPGQGKRWTVEDTMKFYQGLRLFGTDFQMISRMFPGSTRRSIKTKFTREEREHPDDIREALLGQSELSTHWDTFLKTSQMEEDEFADADEIKRQLAEEEAEMRERITAANAETLERKRQQKEAGVLDEEGEGNDKENGKGKKKRKGKEKQVTFEEEKGVEIVGNIDDDENWGRE